MPRRLFLLIAVLTLGLVPIAEAAPGASRVPPTRRSESGLARTVTGLRSPISTRTRIRAHRDNVELALGRRTIAQAAPGWQHGPVVYRLLAALRGARSRAGMRALSAGVEELERSVGAIEVPPAVPRSERLFYRAERAVALASLGRKASALEPNQLWRKAQVVTGFSGDSISIGERDIHTETLKAIGPTRAVVRLAPGYQETAGSFFRLADALNRQGIEVVLMDQQWTGSTQGSVGPGQIDSAEGVALDTATVDRFAQGRADQLGVPFALMGQSLGGGPGTLLSQALAQRGNVRGPAGAPPIIVLAPYVAPSPAVGSLGLRAGRVPLLRELPMIAKSTHPDPDAQRGLTSFHARTQTVGRAVAYQRGTLSAADLTAIRQLANPITVVMSRADNVASFPAIRALLPGARFVAIGDEQTSTHTNQHTPGAIPLMVDAVLDRLGLARQP